MNLLVEAGDGRTGNVGTVVFLIVVAVSLVFLLSGRKK